MSSTLTDRHRRRLRVTRVRPLGAKRHRFVARFLASAIAVLVVALGTPPAEAALSWVVQSSGTTAVLNSVSFVDTNHGWAVGDNGTILATTDGGQTWSAETSGVSTSTDPVRRHAGAE